MNEISRRTLLAGAAVTAASIASAAPKPSWRPKIGLLAKYTPGNVAFARNEGFTSIGLWDDNGTILSSGKATDEQIAQVRADVANSGLYLSVLGANGNHIDPDPDRRKKLNFNFAKALEMAGKLGAPFVGTQAGIMPGRPLKEQAAEVVRVYEQSYFPVCQKYNLRILWEPWPDGPNIATGPQGYDALFTAFGNSPYVGLQFDPSHAVRMFMDPIQIARDYVAHIYDVHLKDTEIEWSVLRRVGIRPFDHAEWWRYRIPGNGSIDWPAFFTVLEGVAYAGAMNIEHEDDLYGAMPTTPEFTEDYKNGFRVGHQYLRQYVPAYHA